ncbi:MAG: ABC transporter ATP-binding protein [Thermoleophilia bacterium]|nr:ABC transporter ATP-binding protein [Thermoleophilia bacterium]
METGQQAAIGERSIGQGPRTPLLRMLNVAKHYGDKVVLENMELEVFAGEYITVLGPSGSGKSVLLRLVAGFEEPSEGRIEIGGRDMAGVPTYRRHVGLVFQQFALFPHLSVGENIGYGLSNRHDQRMGKAEVQSRVDEMLQLVGLQPLKSRRVNQISGGQQQRVALARTLATNPQIVLLDEPLGALDANLRASMKIELGRLQRRLGATFVHVTGNEEEALAMADRLLVLEGGRIAQFDTPNRVFAQPASAYVAFALNRFNLIPGAVNGAFVNEGISLPLPSSTDVPAGPAVYAIGYDRVEIAELHEPVPAGLCSVVGRHVAHEYSGAILTYLFELQNEHHFEVQYHLHHRESRRLQEGAEYRLNWDPEKSFVYTRVAEIPGGE